jgi:hypothetical protein
MLDDYDIVCVDFGTPQYPRPQRRNKTEVPAQTWLAASGSACSGDCRMERMGAASNSLGVLLSKLSDQESHLLLAGFGEHGLPRALTSDVPRYGSVLNF